MVNSLSLSLSLSLSHTHTHTEKEFSSKTNRIINKSISTYMSSCMRMIRSLVRSISMCCSFHRSETFVMLSHMFMPCIGNTQTLHRWRSSWMMMLMRMILSMTGFSSMRPLRPSPLLRHRWSRSYLAFDTDMTLVSTVVAAWNRICTRETFTICMSNMPT